jgi:hypothetical protein
VLRVLAVVVSDVCSVPEPGAGYPAVPGVAYVAEAVKKTRQFWGPDVSRGLSGPHGDVALQPGRNWRHSRSPNQFDGATSDPWS